MSAAVDLGRAVRSELAKLSWRSPVWLAIVPVAVLLPLAVNASLAIATQMNKVNGTGGMDTNNAGYWVMIFSTIILMAAGVTSLSNEFKYATAELVYGAEPRRWMLPVAKAIVFGLIAAAATLATVLVLLAVFPAVFPDVWGRVDLTSSAGLRLLWALPVFDFFVSTLGIGIAGLVPRPGVVVGAVLLWKFGIETFSAMLPVKIGNIVAQWMPFKNGELGAGQYPTTTPAFGGANGALAYFALLASVFFVIGMVRLSRRDLATD
ncbi:putative ABC transporter, membrane protein [Nocardia nova SH22a]|uniref:Putative ABC transporter, membrane protein n=1 Tax=Nocardia nova SH22a TaxID=1415166 RepID=W5TI64_9NOCA|nr:ABC transporter permease [Nocardia nova]AHH19045.1 putative ABC transporter, membrane protein [Nocardia nova SH22a]